METQIYIYKKTHTHTSITRSIQIPVLRSAEKLRDTLRFLSFLFYRIDERHAARDPRVLFNVNKKCPKDKVPPFPPAFPAIDIQ